ncbi:MAG: Na+/H+ antiporter subunit E [Dongiaceae bacterium]
MVSARTISLFLVLYGIWLLLSGIWEPFLMIVGALSALLVVILARRMGVIDDEGHPIHLALGALLYLPWLFWQVALSNIDVARRVLSPRMDIDPAHGMVPASQRSNVGLVAFANSITLTPGTVSLSVYPGRIHVHALSRAGLDDLMKGEMDRRVTRMEGGG